MRMPKPSGADKERFRWLVPDDPRVEIKPMFGQLAAFVNGNMFMGLFGSDVGVKLRDPDRDALLAIEGSAPFGPEERPLRGYVTIPAAMEMTEVERWVARSLEHVAELPPKANR